MKNKGPYELIEDAEEHLDEFIQWQIDFEITRDFVTFAKSAGKAQDVFKYAAVLYPRFVMVEGVVVLCEHYSKENWEQWRKIYSPLQTARVVNHVHVDDYLCGDYQGTSALINELGLMLAFFWQMAVNNQFPDAAVKIRFDGAVIDISQTSIP